MNWKNELDKTAYIMLTISGAISLFWAVVVIGVMIYVSVISIADPESVWIVFVMVAIAIVFFPVIGGWVAHFILYVVGRGKYKKGEVNTARVVGVVNCAVAMMCNVFFLWSCNPNLLENPIDWVYAIVCGGNVLYMVIVIALLTKSMCIEEQSQPNT